MSLLLFYFMSALIQSDGKFKEDSNSHVAIEFLRQRKESDVNERQRRRPKAPSEIEPKPTIPKLQVTEKPEVQKPQLKMDMPKLNSSLAKGKGPYLGPAGSGGGNQQAMPVVRIEPNYPRQAAMKGQEGWVLLQFDITEAGTVDNIEIKESRPTRVFDSEARRALLKWKYKPKVIDGKPTQQKNQSVKLEFKLEG